MIFGGLSNGFTHVDFKLERESELPEISIPNRLMLAAQKTVVLEVGSKSATLNESKKLNLPYKVTNLLIGPGQPLPIKIDLDVVFTPDAAK